MSASIPISGNRVGGGQSTQRGKLKVFLGYAAGVGKTFRMLEEAQHLEQQGVDVAIGYFEPHGRKKTIAKAAGLELIPRRTIAYRGRTFEEMDTAAILARHPAVCLVDELAHTNVPGSERQKRWEDVQLLLENGIDVLTTVNIQHLESLNDKVFEISGVRVRETVPDWLVKQADEVVMVDATTGALLNRLKRGDIYDPEKAQRAAENFFKETTLAALRELAMRHTALDLELREEQARSLDSGEHDSVQLAPALAHAPRRDAILVYITPEPQATMLIRRCRRMADFLGAESFAVFVRPMQKHGTLSEEERETVEKSLEFARGLKVETRILESDSPADAILEFARHHGVTQILLARPKDAWWGRLVRSDPVLEIIKRAKDIRVTVVARRQHRG